MKQSSDGNNSQNSVIKKKQNLKSIQNKTTVSDQKRVWIVQTFPDFLKNNICFKFRESPEIATLLLQAKFYTVSKLQTFIDKDSVFLTPIDKNSGE